MPPSYQRLGYKRLIVDYHFSDFVAGTLVNANAADYVRACVELGVDSVLVYAKDHWGNCYFQTDNFPRHPSIPQDLFGEILAGLGEQEITGFAYFSVGWDESIAKRHPEWIMRDANGTQIRRYQPLDDQITGRWRYLCINSPVRRHLLDQITELVAGYDFPALFLDILFMNPGGQICHCDRCQELWQLHHNGEIPQVYTPEYLHFITESMGRFQGDVKKVIADSGKDIHTTHNFGHPYEEDDYVAFEFNALGRNYLRGSAIAKIMRAHAQGREVELIGHRFNQDWDFTTKSPVLMCWEAATVLAHNCALMWVDQPHMDGSFDKAALYAMRASYEVVDTLVPHVKDSEPVAEIALLYSEYSNRLEPEQELDFIGAYKLLSELHWPFDVICEEQLTAKKLQAFDLLVIPHARHMSPEAVASVKQYVENGGRLLFCHETATATLTKIPLAEPSLGFIDIQDAVTYPASFLLPDVNVACSNTYLRVTETLRFRANGPAQILAALVKPNIGVNWDRWVSHNVAPGAVTDAAAVVEIERGQGRIIYCAPRLFAEYIRQGLPALTEFLTELLRRVYRPSLWIEAPMAVEATFNRQGDDLVVVLVNGVGNRPVRGGVMMLGDGPGHDGIDEVIPLHDIRLQVRGRNGISARDMHGNSLVSYDNLDTPGATVVLETLMQHDVIRVKNG